MTSAGLISVKDGLIHTLSPLSGHYRYVDMLTHLPRTLHLMRAISNSRTSIVVSKTLVF